LLVIPAKAGIQFLAFDLRVRGKPKLSLACGERVTFFARAKKVTKESTLCRFEGAFAEATSLCLRRTAHFLCAVSVAHWPKLRA
jgi:hypothetical protein